MFDESANYLETLIPLFVTYGLSAFGALVILIAGWVLAAKVSKKVYQISENSGKLDKTVSMVLRQVVRVLIIILTLLAVLNQFGIETTSIVAVLGAATLAIGLALQGTLSNVAAGVMLLIFRPFKVDDFITVSGVSGSIAEVGLFTTIFRTPDGLRIVMPNAKIWGNEITNFSHNPTRRHDFVFGISYTDDMDKAIRLVTEILEADERILKDPAPMVVISELADSSVNILARPWTTTGDFWAVKWDVIKKVKESFDANDISIPFPQRDVHLYQTSSKA